MHIDEYRRAWDAPVSGRNGSRGDVQPSRVHEPRAGAAGPSDDRWRFCAHLAVSETSVGGRLTGRRCLDCGLELPDREWEPGEEWHAHALRAMGTDMHPDPANGRVDQRRKDR